MVSCGHLCLLGAEYVNIVSVRNRRELWILTGHAVHPLSMCCCFGLRPLGFEFLYVVEPV
jgi:hypothetical protein